MTWLLLTPVQLLLLIDNHPRTFDRRRLVLVSLVAHDSSSKIERDVVDGGHHGTHEGRPGEEERPAVVVREGNAGSRRRRRLLAMGNFVVDR